MENEPSERRFILEYIKENLPNMSLDDREFLIRYIASKKKLNPDHIYAVNCENFLEDLKKLSTIYLNCYDTTLTVQRVLTIVKLFQEYENEMDYEKLIDLSIQLDKLYMDSGLSVRNTDTVLKKIKIDKGPKRNGSL